MWHLVTRFFGVLISRPLGPRAQDDVNRRLRPAEAALFWQQQPIDQRHAYGVAARVAERLDGDTDAVAAALLHDIGKRDSNMGALTRTAATVLGVLHLPMPERWRRYRNHGELGAADLERIGASPLAVAFARGVKGAGLDATVWETLLTADGAAGLKTLRKDAAG